MAEQTSQGTPEGKGTKKRLILTIIIGLAILLGGYFGYKYITEGRFMVETDDAYVQGDVALISSRVQGYVQDIPFDDNQAVKAGDVIVRIDDGDYRIALDTAQSRFETADATLARIDAQIDAARAAIRQAEADRTSAEAQATTARTNAERTRNLAANNVATQAQLDTANEGEATAAANLARAEAAVTSANAQVAVIQGQRAESEGQRRQLELAVDQAQRDLDMTVLRAPMDGTLANSATEVGDLVTAGTRLAAVVPANGLYIEANFKETQMPGVVVGATVHITFDAIPDHEFEGHVVSIAPATGAVFSLLPAENATGNFTKVVQRVPVRISIPDDAQAMDQLRAGLSAVVSVDSRTAPDPS
ncbi:HlyD family secretion protein [Falsirhodobacter sp. alg1]|uniref:HlyD family secretion protein n=1 Tax=Falsirhodobacter sp. alg1 TaxID=1472418 RepID=UPI0005EE71B3|nr:HlyD family secretion protein [Falsirhodobacter sp. alg1]